MPATVLTTMKLSIVIHKTGCIGGGGFLVGENNTTLAGREHCSLYSEPDPRPICTPLFSRTTHLFFSLDSGLRRHFKLFTGVILNTSAHLFRYAAALTYFNIWLVSSPVLRSTTGELMLCAISKHWCRGWLTRTGDHTLPRIPIAVIVDVTAQN